MENFWFCLHNLSDWKYPGPSEQNTGGSSRIVLQLIQNVQPTDYFKPSPFKCRGKLVVSNCGLFPLKVWAKCNFSISCNHLTQVLWESWMERPKYSFTNTNSYPTLQGGDNHGNNMWQLWAQDKWSQVWK